MIISTIVGSIMDAKRLIKQNQAQNDNNYNKILQLCQDVFQLFFSFRLKICFFLQTLPGREHDRSIFTAF